LAAHWSARRTILFANSAILHRPRPVSTLPTEVASRQPCAVVSNSGIAAHCGDRRVGKICRYQSLATTRRQSRDHLSARSCPPELRSRLTIAVKPGGDAEDLRRRIMPETPGRKGDLSQQRLQVARRRLTISHRTLPSRNAVCCAAMISICQLIAKCVRGFSSRKRRCAKLTKSRRSNAPHSSKAGPT